jgi:hypothetical protein
VAAIRPSVGASHLEDTVYRSILAILSALALTFAGTAPAWAQGQDQRQGRAATQGLVYLGTAPGFNFGGKSLPRALYMDFLHLGYAAPSGLDLALAFSGMNFFPDEGDYALSMTRLSVGYRPFMGDPLPMIQPYAFAGVGLGGEGRYVCEVEPSCDPSKDDCSPACGRANWRGTYFLGGGVDLNSHLFWIGRQQLLLYTGVQARYELIGTKYHMPVITFPIGLRIQ